MHVKATIYHNPRCSKSREALAILHDTPGVEVEMIEYLKHPPTADTLAALYARAGLAPRDGLRTTEPGAKTLAAADDAGVLAAMVADPILIERPIVATDKGVVIARPPSRVRDIL